MNKEAPATTNDSVADTVHNSESKTEMSRGPSGMSTSAVVAATLEDRLRRTFTHIHSAKLTNADSFASTGRASAYSRVV